MKRIELIFVLIFSFGLIGQILLLSFSNVLVTLSLSCLTVFYYIFTMPYFLSIPLKCLFSKSAYLGISKLRIVGAILLGFALASVILGVMFRLLILPGASAMLIIGTVWIPIFVIILLRKYFRSKKDKFYGFALSRAIPIFAFGYLIQLIPSNLQVQIFYRDKPDFIELYNEYYDHPENDKLRVQVDEALHEMNSL